MRRIRVDIEQNTDGQWYFALYTNVGKRSRPFIEQAPTLPALMVKLNRIMKDISDGSSQTPRPRI
jgi:hypothetical protein